MTELSNTAIELIDVSRLQSADRNARTHSKKQIRQIAESIRRFGFNNPILVGDDLKIIAGHGRAAAAAYLGMSEVPCVRLSHMTPAERRAYVIADNKLALNAGWDMEILADELGKLIELDFEVDLTGFEAAEVDDILAAAVDSATKPLGPEDECPALPGASDSVTQTGDLWMLGRHRLLCGDAKDRGCISRLMWGSEADMVFTDPPYNVPIRGNVSGLGQAQHREFAEASGEMTSDQFEEFLRVSFGRTAEVCRDGAIVFTAMDWRHLREVLAAGHAVFSELKQICVWSKTNGGMGTFYRSQHEMILVWKVGSAPHTNNFGLGDKGRYRTNVWSYPGVNTFKADRMEELASHPTVKPVAMVADAIRDVSNRSDLVLDTFGGSGTTLIAAEKTGRIARVIEIDQRYCDVIVRRWETLTGKQANLAGTGESFEDAQLRRVSPLITRKQERTNAGRR